MVTLGMSAPGGEILSGLEQAPVGSSWRGSGRPYAGCVHLALIKYSVLRLGLFVASLTVLWAVGVRRSLLMVVLAALVSLALSYLLLGKQRDAVAQEIESRVQRRQGWGQADADAEDSDSSTQS
jgi:uncharacterized protein DUF4229